MLYFSLIGILFIIAVLVLIVYYLIYTKKINQLVCGGNTKGKKMPDFPKVIISVTMILLLSICIAIVLIPTPATYIVGRNNYAVIDTSNYHYLAYSSNYDLDDASFAKMFSKDENMGYTKKEIKDGNFNFIIFTSTTPPDPFHPDFLCYVTYTGDSTGITEMSHNGQFQDIHTNQKGGTSCIGDFTKQTLLIIGNYDEESRFLLTMGVYDELGSENYDNSNSNDPNAVMEDFALSVGSVLIEKTDKNEILE